MLVQAITGAFIRPMPTAVVATLILSFFIAAMILPVFFIVLNTKFPQRRDKSHGTYLSKKISHFVGGSYVRVLRWTLRHKLGTLIGVMLFILGSVFIFTQVGTSFFPKADKPIFRILVDLPEGSNLESTASTVDKIENILFNIDEVDYVASNIGHGSPHINYNMTAKGFSNRHADILVKFKSFELDAFNSSLDHLRDTLATIDEAQVVIKEFVQGPNSEAPIHIKLQSDDLTKLKDYSKRVELKLEQTSGVRTVVNPLAFNTIDLSYNINKEKAIQRNLRIDQIDDYVRTILSSKNIGTFLDEKGDSYSIMLGHENRE
jgi:multidrug efflux pump subunit AcrB